MTDALLFAGVIAVTALIVVGPIRWLNRWSHRRHDALAAARRVKLRVVKMPDEERCEPTHR